MGYASDITRTIPVGNGGKYTEKAGAIYELVLRMQKVSWSLLAFQIELIRRKLKTWSSPESTGMYYISTPIRS